jgi:hypothetical protein
VDFDGGRRRAARSGLLRLLADRRRPRPHSRTFVGVVCPENGGWLGEPRRRRLRVRGLREHRRLRASRQRPRWNRLVARRARGRAAPRNGKTHGTWDRPARPWRLGRRGRSGCRRTCRRSLGLGLGFRRSRRGRRRPPARRVEFECLLEGLLLRDRGGRMEWRVGPFEEGRQTRSHELLRRERPTCEPVEEVAHPAASSR